MQLLDVNIIGQEGLSDIHVEHGRISSIADSSKLLPLTKKDAQLSFDGALAFPGLINSHDHLDFDLFPQLGNKIYQSYVDWGADIHFANKEQIDSIIRIPKILRTNWGVYKNLLAGVTTVVNHGERLIIDNDLINVFQECQTIHSVKRGKNWKFHLNNFYKRKLPVAIHIGEGTDDVTKREIDQLIRWNYLKRDIIGIHCVAMDAKQASSFKALVWCPVSNDFLLGKTAAMDSLKKQAIVLFGTDSTLTASWNIWDHLRLAREKNLVTDAELYDMLTVNPAKIWGMNDTGRIEENKWANIVVAKTGSQSGKWDALYAINPEDILLVVQRGDIRLFDEQLFEQIKKTSTSIPKFSKVYIEGKGKYVQGDVPSLIKEILKYNPEINFPVTFE